MSKLGDGKFYQEILTILNNIHKKDNNRRDALIGEVAINNQITLVTEDINLFNAVKI